jgi:hypothetical protein
VAGQEVHEALDVAADDVDELADRLGHVSLSR